MSIDELNQIGNAVASLRQAEMELYLAQKTAAAAYSEYNQLMTMLREKALKEENE